MWISKLIWYFLFTNFLLLSCRFCSSSSCGGNGDFPQPSRANIHLPPTSASSPIHRLVHDRSIARPYLSSHTPLTSTADLLWLEWCVLLSSLPFLIQKHDTDLNLVSPSAIYHCSYCYCLWNNQSTGRVNNLDSFASVLGIYDAKSAYQNELNPSFGI